MQLCTCGAVCRGWDLQPGHEHGGDGGGWHSDGHHRPDRGRQRYRAGAIQIVPTTLRWWPNFYNSNFLHLQRQAADFTEAVSRGWNRIPFWTSSAELYQDLSLISFPFCSKIKTSQFLPVSIKNPLKTTMKTITFKTRLIGKALFSFNPATQELWGRQDKNARLDREECAGFPGFDYQALSILDSILSLAQTQPQLVQYPLEKKTKLPCMRVCHTTKQLQKRPGKFQHTTCFLFYPA